MFACLANIPDMDFIPGILVGQPDLYHHGPSHSLIVALIVAYITYAMTSRYYYELENKRFLVALLIASTSHTLLDYFSKDTGQPYGVPFLWPFDQTYYISTASLFSDVERSSEPGMAFILSLFNSHNLIGIAGEALFVIMIVSTIFAVRNRYIFLKKSIMWTLVSILCAASLVVFAQYTL
jgi:membrane-bound metal-dependent hydrolase YbcI (DUF457 family)